MGSLAQLSAKFNNLTTGQKAGIVVAILVVLAVIVVLIMLLIGYFNSGGIYSDPEIFQVSLAGTGYGDGTATYPDTQTVADTLGAQFGTSYAVASTDQVQADPNGQWCNYGWNAGEAWPYCQSAAGASSACCNGTQGFADWHDMNPQPGIFLYGQKPKAGQIPLCSDTTLKSGTQCIGNWSSGDGLTPVYSKYD